MDNNSFLPLFAEVLQVDPASIRETTPLADGTWDSMAMLGAMALIDREYGLSVLTDDLKACRTVGDVLRLVRQAAGQS